jgi:hypothetical protein
MFDLKCFTNFCGLRHPLWYQQAQFERTVAVHPWPIQCHDRVFGFPETYADPGPWRCTFAEETKFDPVRSTEY